MGLKGTALEEASGQELLLPPQGSLCGLGSCGIRAPGPTCKLLSLRLLLLLLPLPLTGVPPSTCTPAPRACCSAALIGRIESQQKLLPLSEPAFDLMKE